MLVDLVDVDRVPMQQLPTVDQPRSGGEHQRYGHRVREDRSLHPSDFVHGCLALLDEVSPFRGMPVRVHPMCTTYGRNQHLPYVLNHSGPVLVLRQIRHVLVVVLTSAQHTER